MPLLADDLLLRILSARNATALASPYCGNSPEPCIEVFCGWPLSGQYGFGQRLLYYILVTTCVLARREKWVRTVCIAAALLVPAVAAVHGIILAAMHVEDAVDVDIYGALQFCSIGILAGPITVKNSKTYFNKKGRNTIFIWTGLILAGLLSLAVEFYRANIVPCYHDEKGNSISPNPRKFPYGGDAMCNLTCSQTDGPVSLLRLKAASEIFVTPRPYTLPFGNAMFLAAACCVPALISLVTMRNKIVITNWMKRHGTRAARQRQTDEEEAAETSNEEKQKDRHLSIRDLLNVVEVFVFGGAVLAIVVIGEINFFSPQMDHHTEPMGSIGQWGTIVATGLAILGSLFIYLVDDKKDPLRDPMCDCDHCREIRAGIEGSDNELKDLEPTTDTIETTLTHQGSVFTQGSKAQPPDPGYRRKISRGLLKLGRWFDNTTQDPMAAADIRSAQWPHLPGESRRNSRLGLASDQFSTLGEIEPRSPEHSGSEGGSGAVSPSSRGLPEFPSPPQQKARHNSEPSWPSSSEQPRASSSNEPRPFLPRERAATLEVPVPRAPRRTARRATDVNRSVNIAPTR